MKSKTPHTLFRPANSILLVLLLLLQTVTVASAQDWFTQRTYQGRSRPVSRGVNDRLDEPAIARAKIPGDLTSAVTRTGTSEEIFSATGLPVDIPDNAADGVSSAITVPTLTSAASVMVSVYITHTYRGDLRVVLKAPDGTEFVLANESGGSTDNISISRQALTLAPAAPISGTWTLVVSDNASFDTGALDSWALTVTTALDGALIDLVVSLKANPQGDNDGSTQGTDPNSAAQDKWERIMQHFADAVYEMSNGAHQIRQIRVFRDSKNFGSADVRWDTRGHPHVPGNGGIGVRGGHINMYETFAGGRGKDAEGNPIDKDMLADEEGSGYTQAHEWGHFFFGLYDEYVTKAGDVPVSPSIMRSQWAAKGGNFESLNFSIRRVSGGPFQNTLFTWQHRAYAASAWEVLARPTADDPSDATSKFYQSLGPRIFYPELQTVSPVGDAVPRIDLPGDARRVLDVIWMVDRTTLDIVIDNSGSMEGDPIEQAKTAAKLLVDQAVVGKTRIGVTAFNSTASVVRGITAIDSESDRTSIKSAIDGISADGGTAIGEGAAEGLGKVLGDTTRGENRVVFLLSDGVNGEGREPLSVIPQYAAAHVPLFTFGFGSGADTSVLTTMANETGGRFFFSPTTLSEISAAFLAASLEASANPGIAAGTLTPAAGSPAAFAVPVDSTLDRLQITVVYTGSAPTTSLTLSAPGGQTVAPTSTATVGSETLLFFDVSAPATGAWNLVAAEEAAGTDFSYSISGVHEGVGFDVNTGIRGGETTVTRPGPIILESKLSRSLAIAGASVEARVTKPDASVVDIVLRDDGVFPDQSSNDGSYTGVFIHEGPGNYLATVTFSNAGGTARETLTGAIPAPGVDGTEVPFPEDTPIVGNFQRTQTLPFTVETEETAAAPAIVTNPSGLTALDTTGASFAVSGLGAPEPTIRWQRSIDGGTTWADLADGAGVSGSATASLQIDSVNTDQDGHLFRAVLTNSAGEATSAAATLTVVASPAITIQPVSSTAQAGTGVTLSVAAIATDAIAYRWQFEEVDIPGATDVTYQLPMAQASHAGNYRVIVTSAGNSATSDTVVLTVSPGGPSTARLMNISTRALGLTGNDALIPGFVISGSTSKRLLIRNVGPRLADFGVSGVMNDPRMIVKQSVDGAAVDIASNDNWSTNANAAEIVSISDLLGAFTLNDGSADAALLLDLSPGQYTVLGESADGGTGVAIVELYDSDPLSADSKLVNISNRGFVGTGGEIMIPGFVVSPGTNKTLLVRAVGPGLTTFGVTGVLADPKLTVFLGDTALFSNDDWQSTPGSDLTAQVADQVGAFPLEANSKDAAFVLTLPPGSYTVQAAGADDGTGIALVELFEVP